MPTKSSDIPVRLATHHRKGSGVSRKSSAVTFHDELDGPSLMLIRSVLDLLEEGTNAFRSLAYLGELLFSGTRGIPTYAQRTEQPSGRRRAKGQRLDQNRETVTHKI